MDKITKKIIWRYCFFASLILFFLPVCKITSSGVVIRAEFPHKYVTLVDFIRYKSNSIHIDWSLLAIEFLLLTFIFVCIYIQDEEKNNAKDKKKE